MKKFFLLLALVLTTSMTFANNDTNYVDECSEVIELMESGVELSLDVEGNIVELTEDVKCCQMCSKQKWINGYYRSNGTWVNGHYRTVWYCCVTGC